jgi:hypothetical protein
MGMRHLLVVLLVVVGSVGGCDDGARPDPAPTSSTPTSPAPTASAVPGEPRLKEISPKEQAVVDASRASATAPRAFRERPVLASCGEFGVDRMADAADPRTIPCLIRPSGDTGAELTTVAWTPEGDPVVTYYRSVPGAEGIETFVDWTRDAYGPEPWTHERHTVAWLTRNGI